MSRTASFDSSASDLRNFPILREVSTELDVDDVNGAEKAIEAPSTPKRSSGLSSVRLPNLFTPVAQANTPGRISRFLNRHPSSSSKGSPFRLPMRKSESTRSEGAQSASTTTVPDLTNSFNETLPASNDATSLTELKKRIGAISPGAEMLIDNVEASPDMIVDMEVS